MSILLIPSILEGYMIVGDPILYFLSLISLYGPIILGVVVIKILWDRRKRRILTEM